MILQALDAYYRRKQTDPDPAKRLPPYGFEEKEIPFILELAHDGTLVQISDTRSGSDKKEESRPFPRSPGSEEDFRRSRQSCCGIPPKYVPRRRHP